MLQSGLVRLRVNTNQVWMMSIFWNKPPIFLTSGIFAPNVGDLRLLGLANVLQLPMLILSTQNLVPFINIHPCYIVGKGKAILLSFNHPGPGHNNAFVCSDGSELQECQNK